MGVHESDAASHQPLRFDKKPNLRMRPDVNFRQSLHILKKSRPAKNIPASQLSYDYWVGKDIVVAQM